MIPCFPGQARGCAAVSACRLAAEPGGSPATGVPTGAAPTARMRRNRRPKIYYATQVDVAPPTIVLFCNAPNLFDAPYRRFLTHALREATPFAEIPIRLWFRRRSFGKRLLDLLNHLRLDFFLSEGVAGCDDQKHQLD